jgi:hypothetical protein
MVTKRPTAKTTAKPREKNGKRRGSSDPTLWADIAAIFASVPAKDWAAVPHDAARRFDELIEGEGR